MRSVLALHARSCSPLRSVPIEPEPASPLARRFA